MSFLKKADASHLFPVLRSLAVEQLSRSREAWDVKSQAQKWSPQDSLDDAGIGVDSLDLLALAQRVNEMFLIHEVGIEDYLLARRRFMDWGETILSAWKNSPEPRVRFRSSGTTGDVKSFLHHLSSLDEECVTLLNYLPPASLVMGYVPPHHIYGFIFTVIMPVLEDCSCVDSSLAPLARPTAEGVRVVSFPEHWKVAANWELGGDATGVSSTAPLSPELASDIRQRGITLHEIYGSSDSAGVGFRNRDGGPYRLLDYWRRNPDDDSGITRRIGGNDYQVRLPDRIEWVNDREFYVGGRRDEVVQVGGVNVSLSKVATVIEEHPQVRRCAVRLMTPGEGERLKAFIVAEKRPRTDEERRDVRESVEAWITKRLPASGRPRHLTFGEELPSNGLGKIINWRISM